MGESRSVSEENVSPAPESSRAPTSSVSSIDRSSAVLQRSSEHEETEQGAKHLRVGGRRSQSRFPPTWAEPFVKPAGYFLISRLALGLAVLASEWLEPAVRGLNALGSDWDGYWYLKIAQYGYPSQLFNEGSTVGPGSSWSFFPAFPAAIRGVSFVTTLSYVDAGLLAAFIFGLTSAIAVWLAVRQVFSSEVADRAVLLYVFFPSAFVLSMSYAEGLFVTCAAFCLVALKRHMWITASLLTVVGSLTRPSGAMLVLAVAVTCIQFLNKRGRLRVICALAIAPLGDIGWLLYSWRTVGTPFAYADAQRFWTGAHFAWFTAPFRPLGDLLTSTEAWRSGTDVVVFLGLVFTLTALALLVWAWRSGVEIPASWWVYTIGSVLAESAVYWTYSYALLRYTFAIFPLFAAIAWRARASWTGAIVGLFAVAQGCLTVVALIGFVHAQPAPLVP